MDFRDLRNKFPDAVTVIDMVEELMNECEKADDACAEAMEYMYKKDYEKALLILERRAAKVITDAFIKNS